MNRWILPLVLVLDVVVIAALILISLLVFKTASAHPRTKLPPQVKVVRSYEATVTAYAPGDGSGSYASDGTKVYYGLLACPYSLAYGTKVRFTQHGADPFGGMVFVCHDRSATREGLFDIWTPSLKAAQAIGRQRMMATILR